MKRLIAGIMCVFICAGFCACGKGEEKKETEYNPWTAFKFEDPTESESENSAEKDSEVTMTGTTEKKPEAKPVVFDEEVKRLISQKIEFSKEDFTDILKKSSSSIVKYPCEEIYDFDEAYAQYRKLPSYKSTHENYFSEGELSADKLMEIIKSNNEKADFDKQKKISDSDLKFVCELITEVLNDYAKNASKQECAFLSEKLAPLTLIKYTGFSMGFYDSSLGRIGFDITKKNDERFPFTVAHEIYHLIQGSSLAENSVRGFNSRIGICYSFTKDTKNNPLEIRWFFEGCADALASKFVGRYDQTTYENYIDYLNLMIFSKLPCKDVDPYELFRLSMSSEIEDLFEYFGCENEAEQRELLNALCSVNYYTDNNGSGDAFFERYEKTYGKDYVPHDFRSEVSNSFTQTMIRYYFRSLAELLENKEITIEELFMLVGMYEFRLQDCFITYDFRGTEDMAQLYLDYQTMLFDIVASYAGTESDVIRNAFDAYYPKAEFDANNISLLNSEEAEYLNRVTADTYNQRYRSIYSNWQRTIGN